MENKYCPSKNFTIMNETEFSRRFENMILSLMKDKNNIGIDEDYVICDKERKVKVSINIKEE